MPSAFNPEAYVARQQAKQDYKIHRQEQPEPSSVPQLLARVQLLERLLGL